MTIINKQLDTHHTPASVTLLRALSALESLQAGQTLLLTSRQHDTFDGIQSLCRQTGHTLMQYMVWDGEYSFLIRKPDNQVEAQPIATEWFSSIACDTASNSYAARQ